MISTPASATNFQPGQSVSVSVDATDNIGVTTVELYLDGVLFGSLSLSPYSFNLGVLSVGTHSVYSKAYDAANNSSASASVSFTVKDTIAPTVFFVSPTGSQVPKNKTTRIQASASDNIGITKYEFYVNNILKYSGPHSYYDWLVPRPRSSYTLMIQVYDAAGNMGSIAKSVTSY